MSGRRWLRALHWPGPTAIGLGIVGLLALGIAVAAAVAAPTHRSGCHAAHTCPSDHHTYVWYDGSGQGWDCVEPGAPEQTAEDTTVIVYDGLTYYCHAAGPTGGPTSTTSTTTPSTTGPTTVPGTTTVTTTTETLPSTTTQPTTTVYTRGRRRDTPTAE